MMTDWPVANYAKQFTWRGMFHIYIIFCVRVNNYTFSWKISWCLSISVEKKISCNSHILARYRHFDSGFSFEMNTRTFRPETDEIRRRPIRRNPNQCENRVCNILHFFTAVLLYSVKKYSAFGMSIHGIKCHTNNVQIESTREWVRDVKANAYTKTTQP